MTHRRAAASCRTQIRVSYRLSCFELGYRLPQQIDDFPAPVSVRNQEIPPLNLRNRLVAALLFAVLGFPTAALSASSNQDELRAVLELQRVVAEKLGSYSALERIESATARLGELDQEDLEATSEIRTEASKLRPILELLSQRLDEVAAREASNGVIENYRGLTRPLTPADYFNDASCASNGTERFDPLTVFISEQALFVAETVREEASRGCDETVVIAGEGGNTSLLCIVTDIIFIVAKETHNVFKFCDDTVNSAETEGAFERTEDIYRNLNEHNANLGIHDIDIKALLEHVQAGVDENTRMLRDVSALLGVPAGQTACETPPDVEDTSDTAATGSQDDGSAGETSPANPYQP